MLVGLVYHGSQVEVRHPSLIKCREYTDFGKGFYVTRLKEQAERWALRRAGDKEYGVVTVYELTVPTSMNMLKFHEADLKWVEMIQMNRMGTLKPSLPYDLIEGPVADDTMFVQFNLFLANLISKQQLLENVRYQEVSNQIAICSDKGLSCLKFISSYEVRR